MSMKMMKKAAIGVVGLVALAGASAVQAQTFTPGYYEFSGETTLSYFGIPVTCELEIGGDIAADLSVVVTHVETSGSNTCDNSITFNNLPWDGQGDSSAMTLDIYDVDVTVAGFFGCSGDVTAPFNNGSPASAPSYFTLASVSLGSCNLNGTLTVDPVASDYPDINI